MAKGDDSRVRNQIDQQGGLAQNNLNNLRTRVVEEDRPMFRDNYVDSVNRQLGDYNRTMGGFNEFAQTGGFSPMDISNMRSRGMAPVRAAYGNAQRNINRNVASSGGYSPGYNAAMTRLSRDAGQGMSDAAVNVEAALAQMRQQGRLAGLGGASQLYGTTPGQINTFGNQLLQNTQQQLGIENQQQNLGLGLINAQQQAAQLPGRWEHTVGRISDVIGLGSQAANAYMGLPGGIRPIQGRAIPGVAGAGGASQGGMALPGNVYSQGVSQGVPFPTFGS